MKSFCNNCGIESNQKVIVKKEKTVHLIQDDDYTIYCYQLIECAACNNYSYRTLYRDKISTEFSGISNSNPWKIIKLYPESKQYQIILKEILNIPTKTYGILTETVSSFNNGCYILCASGIRSTIESIYLDRIETKAKDGKLLKYKIEELAELGILTKRNSEVLQKLRFMGNKALHELKIPTKKELEIALEILEITLNSIYHLESRDDVLNRISDQ